MKNVKRERKLGLIVFGAMVAIVIIGTMLQSCSSYTCPTYH